MKTNFITTFYNNNYKIDNLAYNKTILSHQTEGVLIYDENNYPFKYNENSYYHKLRQILIGKHIGHEQLYFDQI